MKKEFRIQKFVIDGKEYFSVSYIVDGDNRHIKHFDTRGEIRAFIDGFNKGGEFAITAAQNAVCCIPPTGDWM